MKSFDLTHKLNNLTPVYPGTEQPVFSPFATIEKTGYRETKMSFHSHLGTHIDAPAHMLKDGKFLDDFNVSDFFGNALIIRISENTKNISEEIIHLFKDQLSNFEFVLFQTGWNKFWGYEQYFSDFPVLTPKAIELLCRYNLKGIGFDTISADPVESSEFENHFKILENKMLIIENLNFPLSFKENKGTFYCFPLYFEDADGSPVRAVLTVD